MGICQRVKDLLCCNRNIVPSKTKKLDESKLFGRKEEEIKKIPTDGYICPECDLIPEILEIHSYTGKLTMNCNNSDQITNISATKYIDELIKHNIRCEECGKRKENESVKSKSYCIDCKKRLCEECSININKTHYNHKKIPILELKYRCKSHPEKKAEKYCLVCEEPICDEDINHSEHRKVDTKSLQSKANDYRRKCEEKMQKLENLLDKLKEIKKSRKLLDALRLYKLAKKYENEEAKKIIKNSIEKETKMKIENIIEGEIDENYDNYVDLAVYYVEKEEQKKKEEQREKEEQKENEE